MEELNKLPLWSDGKSDDDINCQAENDSEAVIYHLLEDIKCLKEDNKKLIGDGFKESQNIEKHISISEDAYNMLLSAHNDLSKLTDEQQKKIERLETQCYKNAGTFGRLLDALVLSWDQSLNGNEVADKMRSVTQEYGYCMACRAYCDGDCDS